MAALIYGRFGYSFDVPGAKKEEPVRVDHSEEVAKYKAGMFFVTETGAPGYGSISYIITRIDDEGIWGVLHEDKTGILEPRDVI
jgi:hypothetical protein